MAFLFFLFVLGFSSFSFCQKDEANATPTPPPPPLLQYNINPDTVSVSGISSGGYMSHQMFVIYSSLFQGVGVVAGGPYHCAESRLKTAVADCMDATDEPDTNKFIEVANNRSGSLIDETSNMSKKNAYVLSGDLDTVISTPVVESGIQFLENYGVNVIFEQLEGAEHCQPTDDHVNTNACSLLAPPYISYCDYDAAGATLQTIYSGSLNPRNNGTLNGTLVTFNQYEFGSKKESLGSTGYLYVPDPCAIGEKCTLHVAFHGCFQNVGFIGTDYVSNAGYNKWADTNNMIILYPQTKAQLPDNGDGCWDWWGYTNDNYDTNEGDQPKAVMGMINQMMGNS